MATEMARPVLAPWRQRFEHLASLSGGAEPPTPYRCGECQDTGWRQIHASGAAQVVRCTCLPRAAHALGVPLEFRGARLANYDPSPGNEAALRRAHSFLAGQRDLLLVGGVGAGKTRLACSILNERPAQGLFTRVALMLRQLEPGGDESLRRAFEGRLFSVPVLVLDDLGAERDIATDFTRRTLLNVYEARGDQGLRTIWTSNKDLRQLAGMQDDDRLTSRIAGRADIVLVDCDDQRILRRPGRRSTLAALER